MPGDSPDPNAASRPDLPSTLRLLVVIANFGVKNDGYMRRVVEEYRSLPCKVKILVLSNIHKEIEGAEVVIHTPQGDPWTFPFEHKRLLAESVDDYDLFIYSEDDTLITQTNIAAFLEVTAELPENEIAGFLRSETSPDGQQSISTINGHFHWDPHSVVHRAGRTFAYFSNEHAASYILTRDQLKRAIQSGGFLVPPHQEKYDLLVTAATDPYTQCGFRKLICISEMDRFLIAHLPNKYLGQFGISVAELHQQIRALEEIGEGTRPPEVLARTETGLRHQRWSRRFYDSSSEDVLSAIPKNARTILSYGCGSGALEEKLKSKGFVVTAVPLDSVVGASVEARGVDVIYGDEHAVWRKMGTKSYDCVLILDLLHLSPDPAGVVARMGSLLTSKGSLIVSMPNVLQARTLWKRIKKDPAFTPIGNYDESGVQEVSSGILRKWFRSAGLATNALCPRPPQSNSWLYRTAFRIFPDLFADEFVAVAQRRA